MATTPKPKLTADLTVLLPGWEVVFTCNGLPESATDARLELLPCEVCEKSREEAKNPKTCEACKSQPYPTWSAPPLRPPSDSATLDTSGWIARKRPYRFRLSWTAADSPTKVFEVTCAVTITESPHHAIWGHILTESEEVSEAHSSETPARIPPHHESAYADWRNAQHPAKPPAEKSWQRRVYDAPEYGGEGAFPETPIEVKRQRQAQCVYTDAYGAEGVLFRIVDELAPTSDRRVNLDEVASETLAKQHQQQGYQLHPPTSESLVGYLSPIVKKRVIDEQRRLRRQPGQMPETRSGRDVDMADDGSHPDEAPPPRGDADEDEGDASLRFGGASDRWVEEMRDVLSEYIPSGGVSRESIDAGALHDASERLREALGLRASDSEGELHEIGKWLLGQRKLFFPVKPRAKRSKGQKAKTWDPATARGVVASALRLGHELHRVRLDGGDGYRAVAEAQFDQMNRVLAFAGEPVPTGWTDPAPNARLAATVGRTLDDTDEWRARTGHPGFRSGFLFHAFLRLFPACHFLSHAARWVRYLDGPPVRWPTPTGRRPAEWAKLEDGTLLDSLSRTYGARDQLTPFGWLPDPLLLDDLASRPDSVAFLLARLCVGIVANREWATPLRKSKIEIASFRWHAALGFPEPDSALVAEIVALHEDAKTLDWTGKRSKRKRGT